MDNICPFCGKPALIVIEELFGLAKCKCLECKEISIYTEKEMEVNHV